MVLNMDFYRLGPKALRRFGERLILSWRCLSSLPVRGRNSILVQLYWQISVHFFLMIGKLESPMFGGRRIDVLMLWLDLVVQGLRLSRFGGRPLCNSTIAAG